MIVAAVVVVVKRIIQLFEYLGINLIDTNWNFGHPNKQPGFRIPIC
jgi:hypothetical protein